MNSTIIMMRRRCFACGAEAGELRPKNGQDCVFCQSCGRFQYNAPKTETGKEPRTVPSRDGLKPAQRYRILQLDLMRCTFCGKSSADAILHVDHILSLKQGLDYGLTESQLNDDENLVTLCETCNLGKGQSLISLRLLAAVLKMRSDQQLSLAQMAKVVCRGN